MQKVYFAYDCNNDIIGVFSTEPLAKEAASYWLDSHIEEWTLDEDTSIGDPYRGKHTNRLPQAHRVSS